MKTKDLVYNTAVGPNKNRKTIIEPFKIKMIEPLPFLSENDREKILQKAGYNLFSIDARHVTFDFLTDSGTSAMSAAQWASMIIADESYAGSTSFRRFEKTVQEITGYTHVIPTHQGRASERLLFSALVRPGMKVPSNNHFDTTRANIEQLGADALDLVIKDGKDPKNQHPFKGNIDLDQLKKFLSENQEIVPFGMLTITNNTGGGQPVSLENIRQAAALYKEFGVPFILDACRFAENSWFIKEREPKEQGRSIKEIVRDCFSLADGCLISGKKDGLSNIGGFIALKDAQWLDHLRAQLILTEGFPTYGGLAARDLEALACGLNEVLDESYLSYRIATSRYMANNLEKMEIPTVQPAGGHAVYIDAKAFLPHIPPHEFPGQALVCEMYRKEGIRACEIGSVMFGKQNEHGFQSASMELVRLAFPRRVYTQSHFDYILEGMAEIGKNRSSLRGMKMTWEPPFLRHFTAQFMPL